MKPLNKKIILLLILALCACEAQFKETELIGTYKANHGKGEDIIIFKKIENISTLSKLQKSYSNARKIGNTRFLRTNL